jgi:hypothetical protein
VDTAAGEECDDGKQCDDDEQSYRTACDEDRQCGFFVSCAPLDGDGCSAECKEEFCGDGITQPRRGEQCDNGGHCASDPELTCSTHTYCRDISGLASDECVHVDTPECSSCVSDTCGDGRVSPSDPACDDGKQCVDGTQCGDEGDCSRLGLGDSSCVPRDGDGCSARCEYEDCGDGKVANAGRCPDGRYCSGSATCSDGTRCPVREECDTRGVSASCDLNCTYANCGDGTVNPVTERCDDGAHCADGTECALGSACADGSSCRARGPTPTNPYGNATCNEVCEEVTPTKCCTCYYEEHPECAGRSENACRHYDCTDGIDNDGDGKVDGDDAECDDEYADPDASESQDGIQRNDCAWSDGQCGSRFEQQCAEDFDANGCSANARRTLPQGQSVPYPAEPACTETQDFTTGHSGPSECTSFVNQIRTCVECSTTQCQRYVRTGCSTFEDLDAARRDVQGLRWTMRRYGIDSVVVEGNQMLASPTCMSIVKFTVTDEGVNEEYGPCNFGDYCYQHGERYRCTKPDGTVTDGICCTNPSGLEPPFVRAEGQSCPRAFTEGTCSGVGTAWSCSPGATSAAWTDANRNCETQKAACVAAHPNASFSRACDGEMLSKSSVSCTWSVACNWTCTP